MQVWIQGWGKLSNWPLEMYKYLLIFSRGGGIKNISTLLKLQDILKKNMENDLDFPFQSVLQDFRSYGRFFSCYIFRAES